MPILDIVYSILWILAWTACILLFTIPQIWGAFFTVSLIGHLSHHAPGSGSKRDLSAKD